MGEKKLALLLKDGLFAAVQHLQCHIPQRKPLHLLAQCPFRLQRDQRSSGCDHSMSDLFRQPVPIPCGSCGRIGKSARGKNDAWSFIACTRSVSTPEIADCVHSSLNALSSVSRTCSGAALEQTVDHISRVVRARKDAVSPFCLQRNTQRFKKRLHSLRWELVHCTVKELPIPGDIAKYLFRRAIVGQIAAALSRDIQLAANFRIAFQQPHRCALPCRPDRSHTAGCAARPTTSTSVPAVISHSPLFRTTEQNENTSFCSVLLISFIPEAPPSHRHHIHPRSFPVLRRFAPDLRFSFCPPPRSAR